MAEDAAIDIEKLPAAAAQTVEFVRDIQPILAASCYDCHGPDMQEAGLRLDVRKKALGGADSGPVIVPRKSADSRLIHLVAGLDEETGRMPPEDMGEPLTKAQIALLRTWIDSGANWPDEASGEEGVPAGSDHWSFQPIERPAIPHVKKSTWPRNSIDAFILQKLEAEGIEPSPEADRVTLLRRVYLDVIGLPPRPEEVRSFSADDRPDAYDRAIDRLLESPHYGERWGRHWLDAARYADSDGYEKDEGRPFAWRYRDWVIGAFNRDLPFDVFTVQQLAGDLLSEDDPEYDEAARVATGFHRNTLINKEGGIDPEEDRVKRTIDRTNTMGSVWLGLSVGCANCHTHKYDPISQREYFGLYAFFNNLKEVDLLVSSPVALAGAPSERETPIPSHNQDNFQAVTEELTPRETYVHLRGDFLAKGPAVQPHTLEVLPPLTARGSKPDRLDLARWLVNASNPLTARVIANRIWQIHFGRGLVPTGDDFGTQGDLPSHPQLLDWLASELRDNEWHLKPLHRLILTSAVYRQSAVSRAELADRDPYNVCLARQNRLRVEAEIVRDLALSASGLLRPRIGGPSVRPPQPPGVSDITFDNSAKWEESKGADRYRRGMYTWLQRTSPYPSLIGFDAPESILTCTRRERSNTPLQALTLLNDTVFVECFDALGDQMVTDLSNAAQVQANSPDARIVMAFEHCLARQPSARELHVLRELYEEVQEAHASEAEGAEAAACTAVARAIMNLDEFLTRE
jgi:hypothetical protein